MSYFIAYPNEGRVAILTPAPGIHPEDAARIALESSTPRIVVAAEQVPDLYFADAFRFSPDGIKVDVEAAKEVQRNRWRARRKPILEKLDGDFMRAIENRDPRARRKIIERKNALRDVTKTELPDDLEGIKASWPACFE